MVPVSCRGNPLTSSATAGDAFASMLLGTPASGSLTTDVGVSMQSFYFAGYVQDDIKVTNKLTVNAGLRYDSMGHLFAIISPKLTLLDLASGTRQQQIAGAVAAAAPSGRSNVLDHVVYGLTPRQSSPSASRPAVSTGCGVTLPCAVTSAQVPAATRMADAFAAARKAVRSAWCAGGWVGWGMACLRR